LAAVAAAALLLTGCSDDGEPQPEATSSASAEAEEMPSGDPTVETSDGGEVVTSGELGEEFPEKKVPLLPGKVLSAASSPDTGYNVVMVVDGKPKKVSKKAVRKLKKAGFKVKSERSATGGFVTELRSPDYTVEIAATPSGAQTSLNYVILSR
jgi:uncharacterized lipoprotein